MHPSCSKSASSSLPIPAYFHIYSDSLVFDIFCRWSFHWQMYLFILSLILYISNSHFMLSFLTRSTLVQDLSCERNLIFKGHKNLTILLSSLYVVRFRKLILLKLTSSIISSSNVLYCLYFI